MTEAEYCDIIDDEDFDLDESDSDDEPESSTASSSRGRTKEKGKAKIKCHVCTREYKTLESYQNHLGKHALEDLLNHGPGISVHRQFCHSVYMDLLQDVQALQPESSMTTELKKFAERFMSLPTETATIFVDHLAEELWECLPAPALMDVEQLHGAFLRNVHMFLANKEKRLALVNILKSDLLGLTCSDTSLQWFLTHFSRKLASKSEVFFIRCLREPYEVLSRELDRDHSDDINFQQSVHYIGGSAVRSVMRKARMGLGTKAWSDIYDCMTKKFVVGEGMDSPGVDIEAWTNIVDRGGLQHINAKVWSFLIALSGILKREEGDDGSILHENVFRIASSDDAMMFLWHDITENYLSEEVDILLFQNFCEFFTNAWLRGVILRRKNAIPNLSRDKAALRARVTR